MGISFLILLLSAFGGSIAHASGCAAIRAEASELSGSYGAVCKEARAVHSQYAAALPAVFSICERLEAEANAGAPSTAGLQDGEIRLKAMELRKKHLTDQREILAKLDELLSTPLDTARPAVPAQQVDSECTDQIGRYLKFRRAVNQALSGFFARLEESDQALLRPQPSALK